MNINLLAGSAIGLFIGMLVIMVVVMLLFAFILYMVFKQTKTSPERTNVFNVKKMIARRITQLTAEIMEVKDDDAKRNELINKLRRAKSAEALVDELIEEEKNLSGLVDSEEERERRRRKHHPHGNEGQRPAHKSAVQAENKPDSTAQPAADSAVQPVKKAVPPSERPVVKTNVKQEKTEKSGNGNPSVD